MSAALFDILRKVTTATITTMLLKKGIRRCWMNRPKPLVPGGERIVGPAFTLRFVPVREDLATPESWASPISTRAAIEDMPEGVIAVADAMGVPSAGIFGDILCARMKKRCIRQRTDLRRLAATDRLWWLRRLSRRRDCAG
jgi:regulator of RNase E activity RraA